MNGLEGEKIVFIRRWKDYSNICLIFNFNSADVKITPPIPEVRWNKVLDSSERIWNGPGSFLENELTPGEEIIIRGQSFVVYDWVNTEWKEQ